jgi:hypothetical protein
LNRLFVKRRVDCEVSEGQETYTLRTLVLAKRDALLVSLLDDHLANKLNLELQDFSLVNELALALGIWGGSRNGNSNLYLLWHGFVTISSRPDEFDVAEIAFDLAHFGLSFKELRLVCFTLECNVLSDESQAIKLSGGHQVFNLVFEEELYSLTQ